MYISSQQNAEGTHNKPSRAASVALLFYVVGKTGGNIKTM
jgi:hypothetical protein